MGTGRFMNINHKRLDPLRKGRGPVQEHIIDEFVAGHISRREFIRRGTIVGLSAPVLGGILAACGSSSSSTPTSAGSSGAAAGKAGATIKAGILVPAAAINPITIADQGGLELIGNVGEFLVFADQHFNYHPWLATSWSSNTDASVWTFKIRQGVKFNDGTPMTVDDVVYSFQTQSDPKSSANALSVFGGTLSPSGVVKVDNTTVAFHLEHPDAAWLDAVSNDNYNMIIVPKGFDYTTYQKTFPGTGRFKMVSYTPNVGAVYERNPHYWGTKALPAKIEWTFYPQEAPMSAALQAGSIDALDQFSVATSPQLLGGGFNVIALKAATHRQLSMRNDIHPFTSKYARQAIAYTLDRPAIVAALFKGYAEIGNDSPFAPVYKSTVGPPTVAQRAKNLTLAKQLLAKAGVPNGFSTPLLTETTQEMPHFAEIIKQSAAAIGVNIALTIETPTKYYGTAVFGKSDWLDGQMSLVDYGARSVPNVYLGAPLQTPNAKTGSGSWNAARFSNSTYDKLSQQYIAAVDLSTQRSIAQQIETLLLDETPIIFAYFYDYLTATAKNVGGVYPTAQGQFFLWNATKS
jgi:peptide/nickel transport system substrate-binding protein